MQKRTMKKILLSIFLLCFFHFSFATAEVKKIDLPGWDILENVDFLDIEPIKRFEVEFFYAFRWLAESNFEKCKEWLIYIANEGCWYASYHLGMLYQCHEIFPRDFNRSFYWLERALNEVNQNIDKAKIADLISGAWVRYVFEDKECVEEDFLYDFYFFNSCKWHIIAQFFDPNNVRGSTASLESYPFNPEQLEKVKKAVQSWLTLNGYS